MATDSKASAHHVTPLSWYLGTGVALLILTGVTVGVSFIDFGAWNMVVAMAIAGVKMTLVALIFMHLYQDNKLYFVIFVLAIAFLILFIVLTMFDTLTRDRIYEEKAKPIKEAASIYDKDSDTTAAMPDSATGADTSSATDTTESADSTTEATGNSAGDTP